MKKMNTPLMIGIVLLVLGLFGLVSNFSVFLMWLLVIVGAVSVLWGWIGERGNKK
jgi:hypothetical protein